MPGNLRGVAESGDKVRSQGQGRDTSVGEPVKPEDAWQRQNTDIVRTPDYSPDISL